MTLKRFRFRSSKKKSEDTNKSVDEKNKQTEEQIKSAESSRKSSAGSRISSAGGKNSAVVTRKFPMPGGLNSAASHVRRLSSGIGLFSVKLVLVFTTKHFHQNTSKVCKYN
jgi:hypothetical protein